MAGVEMICSANSINLNINARGSYRPAWKALKLSLPAGEKRKLLVNGVEGTGVEALAICRAAAYALPGLDFMMFPDCATLIRATNGWPQNPRWRYSLTGATALCGLAARVTDSFSNHGYKIELLSSQWHGP